MTIPRIFIGYDHVEAVAFHTLCHSIWRHSSGPVSIVPIMLSSLPEMTRDRDPMQSNEFAFSRWLVPYLCGYEGHAVFMDCDMLVTDDIYKLWAHKDNMPGAVSVVKHNHVPKEKVKFLGQAQLIYDKKNWSSVMLFDNSKCEALSVNYVNTAHGLDLHQFKWTDDPIGELPLRWNFLVDYYYDLPINEISNLHFTIGGPYFRQYAKCSYADVWWEEYKSMTHCEQPTLMQHYSETSVKIK